MQSDAKSLRIFHISTSLQGGAGIAATRTHNELLRRGFNSRLLSLDDSKKIENGLRIHRNFLQILAGKITTILNLMLSNKVFFSINVRNALSENYFYPPSKTILHIHNWFNLTHFDFLENLAEAGYLFVFTLHDERNFTGGCHYRFDCLEFQNSCRNCPEVHRIARFQIRNNWSKQEIFFKKYESQIRIIAPSKWILDEALASNMFSSKSLLHIPNFTPPSPMLNLVSEKKNANILTVGVASMEPYSKIKGGEFLKSFEKAIKDHRNIELVTLRDFENRNLGHSAFWSSIDVLLAPSILDNSPNVIHEAKTLGIPVIGTDVGGIPELLMDKNDLIFQKNSDPSIVIEHLENIELPLTREMPSGFLAYVSGNIDRLLKEYERLVNSQNS